MGRWGPGPYWSDGIASDVMYVPISGLFCVLMYPDLMMFSCIGWPNINGPFSFYFVPPAQLLKFLESNDTWNSIFSNLAYISLRLNRQNQSDINRELETKRGLNIFQQFINSSRAFFTSSRHSRRRICEYGGAKRWQRRWTIDDIDVFKDLVLRAKSMPEIRKASRYEARVDGRVGEM